ncbi:MAG: hypothetical protein ACKOFC_02175, partial [Solirubrobacterales bacterium]
MSWLASLPAWLLVALSVAVFVLIALLARKLFERVSRDHPRDNHHAVAASLMPGICAIFGIIAGLTLINQVNNLHRAQEAVSREASAAALTVGRPYTWRLIVPVVAVVAVDIALVIALWLPFSRTIQAGDRPLTDVRQQLQ